MYEEMSEEDYQHVFQHEMLAHLLRRARPALARSRRRRRVYIVLARTALLRYVAYAHDTAKTPMKVHGTKQSPDY